LLVSLRHRLPTGERMPLCLAALFIVASGAAAPLRAEPEFAFGFAAAERYEGHPQRPVRFEVGSTISSSGLEPGALGARAWTMSIAAEGCRISEATTAGTAAAPYPEGLQKGGFSFAEITSGPGNEGVVSGCVLGFDLPVALDPALSPHEVLKLTIEARAPLAGEPCARSRLYYRDGLRLAEMATANEIAGAGGAVKPRLEEHSFELCPSADCRLAPFNVIFQSSPIVESPHVSEELFAGEAGQVTVAVPRGERGEVTLHAAIVSQLQTRERVDGISSWSLSASVRGDLLPLEVTTAGTASAQRPDGLERAGFVKSELVHPELIHPHTGLPQGAGFVSSAWIGRHAWLPPYGTATVLGFRLGASKEQAGEVIEGEVVWYDGMTGSSLYAFRNVAWVEGYEAPLCSGRSLKVRFVPAGAFVRCDGNADGRADLVDAIFVLGALFHGGPQPSCLEAADCNANGRVELTDALFLLHHLFRGGPAPAPPYPRCGWDAASPGGCGESAFCG
jgi:hypothetical protein